MLQNDTNIEKETLTPRQSKAIALILEGQLSLESIAEKIGIRRMTLHRWTKREYFKEKIEQKRQEVFEEGLNNLKAAMNKAAKKLIELLDSKDENIRRLTAKEILNFALKSFETEDLEKRIEAIEEILEKRFVS